MTGSSIPDDTTGIPSPLTQAGVVAKATKQQNSALHAHSLSTFSFPNGSSHLHKDLS
jgi:hypothetical protein